MDDMFCKLLLFMYVIWHRNHKVLFSVGWDNFLPAFLAHGLGDEQLYFFSQTFLNFRPYSCNCKHLSRRFSFSRYINSI